MKRLAKTVATSTAVLLIVTLGQAVRAQETEVEIRRGEVLQVVGNTVLIRVEGEGVKRYTIPSDFRFNHEGSEITVNELREGMILSSVRLRTSGITEEEDIESAMAEIAEAPAAAAEEAAAELSETAETPAAARETTTPSAEAESVEAPAATTTTEQGATPSEEILGMSPALMVGLALLVLIVILLAVRGLGKSEGKKTRK